MTGFAADELIGDTAPFKFWPAEELENINYAFQEMLSGRARSFELVFQRKNGERFPIIISPSPVTDDDGTLLGYIGTVKDISDQKKAIVELAAARDGAQKANKAKSEFLSSMSHELRTPLNWVLGYAQLLEDDPELSPDAKESVAEILRGGRQLLTLISDVLSLSQIESGHIGLKVERVAIQSVTAHSIELNKFASAQNEVSVVDVGGDGVGAMVDVDPLRLGQVVTNLLSNAVKYNRRGGTVRVSYALFGHNVRLTVEDNGIGISPINQSRLFSAFNRLGAESSVIPGTGVGLVIVKKLVEAIGGQVGFRSVEAKGSSFWAEFPVVSSPDGIEAKKEVRAIEPMVVPDFTAAVLLPARRHLILYVEDDLGNQQLVKKALSRRLDIELSLASSASVGVDLATKNIPTLILMDIAMQEIDGFEALKMLRADARTRSIPVVALTALAMENDQKAILAAGFNGYLSKPVDLSTLIATIDAHLPKPVTD